MIDIKQLQKQLESFEIEINNSEKRKSNIEGKTESIQEKLKTDFNIEDLNDLDSYIAEGEEEIKNFENKINNNLKELEKFDNN